MVAKRTKDWQEMKDVELDESGQRDARPYTQMLGRGLPLRELDTNVVPENTATGSAPGNGLAPTRYIPNIKPIVVAPWQQRMQKQALPELPDTARSMRDLDEPIYTGKTLLQAPKPRSRMQRLRISIASPKLQGQSQRDLSHDPDETTPLTAEWKKQNTQHQNQVGSNGTFDQRFISFIEEEDEQTASHVGPSNTRPPGPRETFVGQYMEWRDWEAGKDEMIRTQYAQSRPATQKKAMPSRGSRSPAWVQQRIKGHEPQRSPLGLVGGGVGVKLNDEERREVRRFV